MKKILYITIIIILSSNFLIAQKFKKSETLTKSSNPLEIEPNLNFEINADIDSTIISKETLENIKKIVPLVNKQKNKEALNLVNLISKNDLEKNELLMLKGILELKLEDLSNCYNSFSKYISITQNDSIKSSVYYLLGTIDLKRNQRVTAFQNFKNSYEFDNKNNSSVIALGVMCDNKKEYENAIFYYKIALENNIKLNNIWNNLAFMYQQTGKDLKAKNILTKIIKDEPDSPLPYSNRSYSNLKLGFVKQALIDINKSITLFPENSYAFKNRALIYIKLKEFNKACNDIEIAFKLGYIEKYGTDLELIKTQNCIN